MQYKPVRRAFVSTITVQNQTGIQIDTRITNNTFHLIFGEIDGGALKEGDKKGWRLKNGWKNSGLPWSYKLNKDKMYYKNSF